MPTSDQSRPTSASAAPWLRNVPAKRYLETIQIEAATLLTVAERDLAAPVPTCPGWTVGDVVDHVAEVYQHKIACIRLGRRPDSWPPDFGDRQSLPFLRSSLAELVAELGGRAPESPAYTWYPPDQTVHFWCRRMAHETIVHRVDAQTAIKEVTPVDDDEFALDGIDEVLDLFLVWSFSEDPAETVGGDGQVVAIRAGDRVWRVTLEKETMRLDRAPGPADLTVSGEPSELMLWLWRRLPTSAVTVDGDLELVPMFRELLARATQ
jgi:uncharacterized protein (TIGR03083 family)